MNSKTKQRLMFLAGIITETQYQKEVEENRVLMPNASPEALAKDVEQSDNEYIITRQKRDKIAQDLFKKSYKELNHMQKDKVNSKL